MGIRNMYKTNPSICFYVHNVQRCTFRKAFPPVCFNVLLEFSFPHFSYLYFYQQAIEESTALSINMSSAILHYKYT